MEQRSPQIRIPPKNTESEMALLGSLLLNPSIIKKIKKTIKPEYFYDKKNKIICYAIFDLDTRNTEIDLITLKERLNAAKKLDVVGGTSYIVELTHCVPSSSNAEHYARIVKQKYSARQVMETSDIIMSGVADRDIDGGIRDLISKLYNDLKDEDGTEDQIERLKEVARLYSGDDKVVSFKEVYDGLKDRPVTRFNTGWYDLDKLLTGFRPKHLIMLGGVTKHGKTTFTMDMISKMKEHNPLILSLEEPIDELMEKFMERGEQPPHGFASQLSSKVKTSWIEERVIEGIVKYNSEIVFIDNLGWVLPAQQKKNQNDASVIEETVHEIKSIAKKWNIVVVLLVHVNKDSKADKNPTFEDFKGSSGIAQLCDKAILIWRETKRGKHGELDITNNTNVSVQLNRKGGVGNIKMVYENGHYREFDWSKEQDEESFGDFSSKNINKLL